MIYINLGIKSNINYKRHNVNGGIGGGREACLNLTLKINLPLDGGGRCWGGNGEVI
jgi:hypothetical protein